MKRHLISSKGDRDWQGIPAIERAGNGRLWCAFFSGGPCEPHPANHILLTTSADDGVTWTPSRVVIDPPGATRAFDPCLWYDPSGRLWLFYNLASLVDNEFSLWAITSTESEGENPAWSEPRRIPVDAPFAFRLNKPTVLTNGDWLLPVTWAETAPGDVWFPREPHLQGVLISSDQGGTWSFHGGVLAPAWALENMIVERRQGDLWMLIRTGGGVLWQSVSADGGETWSKGAPTNLVNPGARFFIHRLSSGRLLFINTPDPKRRHGLRACLGEPGADTWTGDGLELDSRDQVSYPDAVQAPDGRIFAVHDHDRPGLGQIILDIFRESELQIQP